MRRRGQDRHDRRGIGPAYEDKVGRRAIRVCDLAISTTLDRRSTACCAHHDALRAGLGQPPVDRAALMAELLEIAPFVLPYAEPVWKRAERGAQGRQAHPVRGRAGRAARCRSRHLSVRHLAPTRRGQAAPAPAWPRSAIGFVLGIVKAYTTRVGSGPFPTELFDEIGQRWASAAMNSAPSPGASAAAAGSTRCWCASPARSPASPASR
jgi:adenylosuccinate synthase